MFEPIIIEKTEKTPEVIFDKENNIFQISGRSIIENAHDFYHPIKLWLQEYLKDPNNKTELVLNYEYLNSSSSLQLMKIIFLLEDFLTPDKKIKVIWLYEKNDEMTKERGEELMNSSNIDFEVKGFIDESEDDYEDFSFDF